MNERFKLIPAVYVLLIKDNKVLLMRRFNTGYRDGQYSLPAGHLDGNESIIHAAIRETYEEVCVNVKPEDLKLVHVLSRPKASDHERVDFFFKVEKWTGEPKIGEPDKCDQIKWVELDQISNLDEINPYVKDMFEKVSQKIYYSDSLIS